MGRPLSGWRVSSKLPPALRVVDLGVGYMSMSARLLEKPVSVRPSPIIRVAPLRLGPYCFKRASEKFEYDQLNALNYQTFVREIPQHSDTGAGTLVDKFHDKSIYYIARRGRRVVGMVTVHDQPPFSVAEKLARPEDLDALGDRFIEARLLAIQPGQRHGIVFAGLNLMMLRHALRGGYSHLLISGVSDRVALYRHIGFKPIGPAVASGQATFVPMALPLDDLPPNLQRTYDRLRRRLERRRPKPVSLMPGPVALRPPVARALARRPRSHRGAAVVNVFERLRDRLCTMVGGRSVGLFCGSGTLGNDVVAASLAASSPGRGLVLVNGEFGRRLVDQAGRSGLDHEVMAWPWGAAWDLEAVETRLGGGAIDWIWAVHLESSTGRLNDIAALTRLASAHGARLCLDAVSSLGAVPIDLSDVYLATGSSGKSLGAVAGLAMVFPSDEAMRRLDPAKVPSYLDLGEAVATTGPRFTMPSGLIAALDVALEQYDGETACHAAYADYEALGRHVRANLQACGIEPLVDRNQASPVMTTFEPPFELSSRDFVRRCRKWGFEVAGMSRYLQERRWAQIATMGHLTTDDLAPFFDRLSTWSRRRRAGLATTP